MTTVGLFAYGEMGYTALTTLLKEFHVLWVIIPPEKETSLEVERIAIEHAIPCIRTNSTEQIRVLVEEKTPNAVIIASYNKILPQDILSKTTYINIHHGDLPRYRGRANINWAIINGRDSIGLTFHEVITDLDAGNIYKQKMVPILETDDVKIVYEKINCIIEEVLNEIVKKVLQGFKGFPQQGNATYCCTRLPEDGLIDWHASTKDIYNLVRALTKPFPGAFTYLDGEKIFIWNCQMPTNPRVYEGRIPGRIAAIHPGQGVEVLTGDGSLIIKDVTCNNKEHNATELITSVKKTLGINWVLLYESLSNKA